jgi:hypothetical protein
MAGGCERLQRIHRRAAPDLQVVVIPALCRGLAGGHAAEWATARPRGYLAVNRAAQ